MLKEKATLYAREVNESTPLPKELDIVKINGRWAQVSGRHVIYLDNGQTGEINWNDFWLSKNWQGLAVKWVKGSVTFTPEELSRIHWGPEQEQRPELKEEVSVFGEYKEKDKII